MLGGMRKVCEGEVQEEKYDQSDEMKEWRSVSCGQDEFAQSEKGVESMPRDLNSNTWSVGTRSLMSMPKGR